MSSNFSECELKIISLDKEIHKSCETIFDFVAIQERYGICDVKFKTFDKTFEFEKIQFNLRGFKLHQNPLQSLVLDVCKFLSTNIVSKILWNCSFCKVGRASIWSTKRGGVGVLILELNFPLEINIFDDIQRKIQNNENITLNLSGVFFKNKDLPEEYNQSLNFIFNSCRWVAHE